MSTAKFTPGPCQVSETKFTPGPWLIEGSGSDIATLRCGLIAVAYDGILSRSIDRDIANANARLISAAPEMYEALQEADRLYSNYALLAQAPEAGPWINKARAALAKAVTK